MAKRVRVEGEIILTTDDDGELTTEQIETLLVDTLEMGMIDNDSWITYYMENGDIEVTEAED